MRRQARHGSRFLKAAMIAAGCAAKAALIAGCTAMLMPTLSSCSRCGRGDGADAPADTAAKASPAAILQQPAVLDSQGLHAYVMAIGENARFDTSDMANMILLCRAAWAQVEQEAENLDRNGDAADSYNVLTEYNDAGWVHDADTLTDFLTTVPLPADLQVAADQLTRTRARVITLLDHIAAGQHNGRHYLEL